MILLGIVHRITSATNRVIAVALRTKLVRAFLLYTEHRGPMLANAITYQALFSIAAAVFVGFAVVGIWIAGDQQALDAIVDALNRVIPGLVGDDALIHPDNLIHPLSFSIAGLVAFGGFVWAASGVVGQTRSALLELTDTVTDNVNVVWGIVRNLLLALIFGIAVLVSAGLGVAGTWIADYVFGILGLTDDSWLVATTSTAMPLALTFVLDVVILALLFWALGRPRADAHALWPGAFVGGLGLIVLQTLSLWFVGGATNNPLLASFGSLVALLLWINLSCQVMLIAAAYVQTGTEDRQGGGRARAVAATFPERRVVRAKARLAAAEKELADARKAVSDSVEKT